MSEQQTQFGKLSGESSKTQELVRRATEGEQAAFEELITHVSSRLCAIAHRMIANYPHVRRWEETDDVMQESLIRLYRGLRSSPPTSAKQFFGLAATILRHTLIDLSRHYYGVYGIGTKHQSGTCLEPVQDVGDSNSIGPLVKLEEWSQFHEAIETLPDAEKEVFSLTWYTGLTQSQSAEVLGVSTRTIIRRMNRARLLLSERLQEDTSGDLGGAA